MFRVFANKPLVGISKFPKCQDKRLLQKPKRRLANFKNIQCCEKNEKQQIVLFSFSDNLHYFIFCCIISDIEVVL